MQIVFDKFQAYCTHYYLRMMILQRMLQLPNTCICTLRFALGDVKFAVCTVQFSKAVYVSPTCAGVLLTEVCGA